MITTREIVDRLKDIYDRLAAAVSFRWGVVVSATPPLVRLDADTDPVIVGTIVPLTVGSRVLVLLQNRKNTVIGSAGGDPNLIVIDGTAYQASGTFETTGAGALHSDTGWYYRSITVPASVPSPPPGWTYMWGVASTSRSVAWVAKGTGQTVQLYNVSAASVTVTIAWQLVKI